MARSSPSCDEPATRISMRPLAPLAQLRCHAFGRHAARIAGRCAVAERETHLALRTQDGGSAENAADGRADERRTSCDPEP